MLIGRVQVVLCRDILGISEPAADDVFRKLVREFRLTSRAHVVERLLPRCQTGLTHDLVELSPHVLSRIPISGDDELGSLGRFVECGFQVGPQFGEQG